jgi:hypothetical protein
MVQTFGDRSRFVQSATSFVWYRLGIYEEMVTLIRSRFEAISVVNRVSDRAPNSTPRDAAGLLIAIGVAVMIGMSFLTIILSRT